METNTKHFQKCLHASPGEGRNILRAQRRKLYSRRSLTTKPSHIQGLIPWAVLCITRKSLKFKFGTVAK